MKEDFPTQSQNPGNPEKLKLEITRVTSDTIHELESIRRATDDRIDEKKFKWELDYYGAGGDHTAFLIRDNGKVIGFVEVDAVADYIPKGAERDHCADEQTFDNLKSWARIGRISLLDEYRGQKIGNTLLDHAEAWARSHGQQVIWLDYLAAKKKLEEFYIGAGYATFMDFKDGDRDRLRRIAVKRF